MFLLTNANNVIDRICEQRERKIGASRKLLQSEIEIWYFWDTLRKECLEYLTLTRLIVEAEGNIEPTIYGVCECMGRQTKDKRRWKV